MSCPDNDGRLTVPIPEIDYSGRGKDLLAEAHGRLLWQFKNSDNICELLTALFSELQDLHDTILEVHSKRQLAVASGEQLNVIGRIVGQERTVIAAGEGLFGWSEDALALGWAEDGVGGGRWLESGESETGVRLLTDYEYRKFIVAKIFKNHIKIANACELSEIARLVLDSVERAQVVTLAPAVISYHLDSPQGLTADEIAIIQAVRDDKLADRQRIITAGAGIAIEYVSYHTGNSVFGWDDDPDPEVGGWGEEIIDDLVLGFDDSPSPKGFFDSSFFPDRPNLAANIPHHTDTDAGAPWAEIV